MKNLMDMEEKLKRKRVKTKQTNKKLDVKRKKNKFQQTFAFKSHLVVFRDAKSTKIKQFL